LFDVGIINTDPTQDLLHAVYEFTAALGMKQNYYWLFITKIKNGELYGGSQTLLAQLYISLENLVLSRMPTTESYKCIKEIEGHIEFLQFIQGDLVKNDFYT